jgi:D-tyrosyl-tRNA(Tyr) deacylase
MRAIIQRVSSASCSIEGKISGEIGIGFMILLGIEDSDTDEDLNWLAQKISNMRIFSDENGLMNKALADVQGKDFACQSVYPVCLYKKRESPWIYTVSKARFCNSIV